MTRSDGRYRSAEYDTFAIGSLSDNYTLSVAGFRTVFPDLEDDLGLINNAKFSLPRDPSADFDGDDDVHWAGELKTFGWYVFLSRDTR